MRNRLRLALFDVLAPLATIAALVLIGVVLGWPRWWVAVCAVLVLLVVEAVAINFWLLRRDSVTVGTDDDRPALRFVVVGLCASALIAATIVAFNGWSTPDRDFKRDSAEVVRIATEMAEATATFTPGHPAASIDRAAALMVPEQVQAFKDQFAKATADLAQRNVVAQASTLEAGVEAIGPSAASVAVIMRGTRNTPGEQPEHSVLALRVALTKKDDRWQVLEVAPIHAR
ncbi:hypothetical protein [Mycobacterium shimoidei]|uniref:hypothetical protein n=1 Tax=Mycobacterium shimoidei TaxID=29313 RepID=UPI0008485851|nr:hypothetical protein [Mycobacterium shimoidei]MCV7258584.1 hypothetical protein [Mycobacterium shimoidei]ODR15475.1 hypothetical protein BHQ16_01755 [Mycobacterium shimoidei]ORW83646.1 hypothetical protein AWC26_01220 [Mycobacterium shimoidei]